MSLNQYWPGWETVRVIGSGGFGKVCEIRKNDDTGEFRSALKVISIPQSPEEYRAYIDDGYDEESITSIFKNQIDDIVSEFKVMAQFSGITNIVSYQDHMIVPHEDGVGWDILIRMELLTALPEYYRKNQWTEEKTIKLGADICRALELCGKKNIIHRDIKPQNIFVNEFGDFKLGDFGVARAIDHTTRATKTGTYSYMAPEVYRGYAYNATADIYSLGLVMYWSLNERRLPFLPLPPTAPTAKENESALKRRMDGEEFPRALHCSRELAGIISKACAADPKERYVSASEMREALKSIGEGHSKPHLLHCEYCGAVITPHTAVCQNCGGRTDLTIGEFDVVCKNCGCITPTENDICIRCGNRLKLERNKKEDPEVSYGFLTAFKEEIEQGHASLDYGLAQNEKKRGFVAFALRALDNITFLRWAAAILSIAILFVIFKIELTSRQGIPDTSTVESISVEETAPPSPFALEEPTETALAPVDPE